MRDPQSRQRSESQVGPAMVARHLVEAQSRAKTATLIRSIGHPDHPWATSQGSAQVLDDGNTFVGWGETANFSEFDAKGRMIFELLHRRLRTGPTVSVAD